MRTVGAALAACFLACLWLDGVGTGLPTKVLPSPLAMFVQVSQLFPHAAEDSIEWHAKGWHCDDDRFEELELGPDFPIHADDKENRFDRAMFFFYRNHRVLEALDRYLARAETARGDRLGGVMLLSIRIPIPKPGQAETRYQRRPSSAYPAAERRYWYVTGEDERRARCGEKP